MPILLFSERVVQGKYKMGLSVVWAKINVALILSQLEATVGAQWPMVRCLSSDKMLKTLPGFIPGTSQKMTQNYC